MLAAAGRFGAVPLLPPYALATPRFRFRALAALVGRSALGGDREVALATLLAARLVVGALPPQPLPQGVRITRANGARAWFAALALPAALRQSLARLVDATTSVDRDGARARVSRGGRHVRAARSTPGDRRAARTHARRCGADGMSDLDEARARRAWRRSPAVPRRAIPIATGFPSVDNALGGGFRRGDLVVLGGEVGSGKSALALAIALRAS